MSGGGSSATSSEPWGGQKDYLSTLFQRAHSRVLNDNTPQQYGEIDGGRRRRYVDKTTGIDVSDPGKLANMGLDPKIWNL
jgi:hypothetical protein